LIALILAISMLTSSPANAADFKLAAAAIPASQKAYAECVSYHESRHNYKAVGDRSSARGRWQFLDKQWRRGLSFMVANRLVDYGMHESKAKKLVKHLQSRPIDAWEPIYQDIGFVAALNAKHSWSGWRHWGVNTKCNLLVPKAYR
jgi:hypothetical protein